MGQNAEAFLVGDHREVEQLLIVGAPVGTTLGTHILDDAEVAHARERGRCGIDRRNRHEVDVEDRELLPPIDEMKLTRARPPDAWNVQLHGLCATRDFPGAQIQAAAKGQMGISDPECHGRQNRLSQGFNLESGIIGMRIDHQIHAALAIQRDFARAMAGHGPKAHGLQRLSEGLWSIGRILDEFDTRDGQGIATVGYRFTVGDGGHGGHPAVDGGLVSAA